MHASNKCSGILALHHYHISCNGYMLGDLQFYFLLSNGVPDNVQTSGLICQCVANDDNFLGRVRADFSKLHLHRSNRFAKKKKSVSH